MAKVFKGELSTFDLFGSGALIYANYYLSAGYSDAETIARLQSRYPAQPLIDLEYVVDLTHRGQQAAAELELLPPGFTNPPSAIPVVPGVAKGGYIVNVALGIDGDGNRFEMRRKIDSDTALSFDELKAIASKELSDIIKKYPDQFMGRGITFGRWIEIEAQLAWFKG